MTMNCLTGIYVDTLEKNTTISGQDSVGRDFRLGVSRKWERNSALQNRGALFAVPMSQ
jgi:hypothetical protein